MRGPGEILVVSCYELGRQPVAAASALGLLEQAGFQPEACDVSVDALDPAALRRARLVAISVPMHTALRIGVRVAARAREQSPPAQVAFYGLYAALNGEHLLARHGDAVFAGAEPLVELARGLESGTGAPATSAPALRKRDGNVPSRGRLPALEKYARLEDADGARLVASVEASRGCKHLCRHCPIVPVYRGRFVAVPVEAVLADAAQQIEAGAAHVSFGDPDFFNGPSHALRVARELHRRWPHVTFDATIKIEHLLQHGELLPELAACGCLFIVSAVESLSDEVLHELHKGHTAADVAQAVRAVRGAGIDLRPTLLPFTPWTRLGDLATLFDFSDEHGLGEEIEPVQYALRLLIPPGSALLDGDEPRPWLRAFEPESFGWRWEHEDPRVDDLWRACDAAVREHAPERLRDLAYAAAGRSVRPAPSAGRKRPRLSEPWFC